MSRRQMTAVEGASCRATRPSSHVRAPQTTNSRRTHPPRCQAAALAARPWTQGLWTQALPRGPPQLSALLMSARPCWLLAIAGCLCRSGKRGQRAPSRRSLCRPTSERGSSSLASSRVRPLCCLCCSCPFKRVCRRMLMYSSFLVTSAATSVSLIYA